MTGIESCMRCGSFLSPEQTKVEGIPCCETCANANPEKWSAIVESPSLKIQRRTYALLFDALAIVYVVSLLMVAAYLAMDGRDDLALMLFAFTVISTGVCFYGISNYLQHMGNRAWRDELIEHFGLKAAIDSGDLHADIATLMTFIKGETAPGLLIRNSNGFIFLSKSKPIAFSMSENVSIKMAWPWYWTIATCILLSSQESHHLNNVYLRILTEPSFTKNVARTEAFFDDLVHLTKLEAQTTAPK